MKKIISLFILISMLSSVALAAPVAVCNSELCTVDVSGAVKDSEGTVITTIIKKDENISPDNFSASVAFSELETDSKGNYTGQFLLPASAERGVWYSVYTSGDEVPGDFYFATEEEISACISAFSDVNEENIESVLNQYVNEKNVLGIDLNGDYSKYPLWAQKAMAELINDKAPQNMTDIRDTFDKSCEAAFLVMGNENEVEAALEKNLLQNNIDTSLSVKALASVYVNNKTIPNTEKGDDITDTIAKNLRSAAAVVHINSATRAQMSGILEEYNDCLDLDLDKNYKKYETEINKALTGKDFTSVEQIQNAFQKKLSSLKKKGDTSSGGGSTSGSGGKIGTGSGVITLPETKPVPEINQGTPVAPFKDIDSVSWAHTAINELYAKKIISGYSEDEYKPDNKVTRAEFTKLVVSFGGNMEAASSVSFSDVSAKDWFAPYIEKAVAEGLVNGNGAAFLPNGNITREDAAVIIYRLLSKKISFTDSSAFSDDSEISEYAKDAVSKLAAKKIINGMGNGTFSPKATLTRAQAAVLIYSALCALQ